MAVRKINQQTPLGVVTYSPYRPVELKKTVFNSVTNSYVSDATITVEDAGVSFLQTYGIPQQDVDLQFYNLRLTNCFNSEVVLHVGGQTFIGLKNNEVLEVPFNNSLFPFRIEGTAVVSLMAKFTLKHQLLIWPGSVVKVEGMTTNIIRRPKHSDTKSSNYVRGEKASHNFNLVHSYSDGVQLKAAVSSPTQLRKRARRRRSRAQNKKLTKKEKVKAETSTPLTPEQDLSALQEIVNLIGEDGLDAPDLQKYQRLKKSLTSPSNYFTDSYKNKTNFKPTNSYKFSENKLASSFAKVPFRILYEDKGSAPGRNVAVYCDPASPETRFIGGMCTFQAKHPPITAKAFNEAYTKQREKLNLHQSSNKINTAPRA